MKKFLFLMLCSAGLFSDIHVICTSAVLEKDYDLRKMEYLDNLAALRSYGYEPWIIEATNISSSFFDEASNQVFYPQIHDSTLRNKGVNETRSMRTVLSQLPFEDDDIVIKMTGRYLLRKRDFIDTVEATQDQFDTWGVFGKHFNQPGDLFTGCFAMRWKYLKKIIEEMDLEAAERDYVAVEILFGRYLIDHPEIRVQSLPLLNVWARICICEDQYYEF